MDKKTFLEVCEKAVKENKGIEVSVRIPGNVELEKIRNSSVDVANKSKYYDGVYDDEMKHKHAPVSIESVTSF